MPEPGIVVSAQWASSWIAASPEARRVVIGATHDLVRRIRAEPKTATRRYHKVKGLCVSDVLEIDLNASWRMVGVYRKGRLHLFAFGDHDLVPSFTDAHFRQCKSSERPAPMELWPAEPATHSFFLPAENEGYATIDASENSAEWLYFLSEEQSAVCEEVVRAAMQPAAPPILILGGPGTGKTSILITAIARLIDEDFPPNEIALRMSAQLLAYINACLPWANIGRFIPEPGEQRAIVLLDDPATLASAVSLIRTSALVVVAVDPLQMSESITDGELDEFCASHHAQRFTLSTCYRQKEAVGAQTAQVIATVARSSPFRADRKRASHTAERAGVTSLANELDFVNPGGRVEIVAYASEGSVAGVARRLLQGPLWRHAPPLLIAVDRDARAAADAASRAFSRITHDRVDLQYGLSAKGLEYQHVVVFITEKLQKELESGFTGPGRRAYEEYRLMRIPFSRAKDSLTIIVV